VCACMRGLYADLQQLLKEEPPSDRLAVCSQPALLMEKSTAKESIRRHLEQIEDVLTRLHSAKMRVFLRNHDNPCHCSSCCQGRRSRLACPCCAIARNSIWSSSDRSSSRLPSWRLPVPSPRAPTAAPSHCARPRLPRVKKRLPIPTSVRHWSSHRHRCKSQLPWKQTPALPASLTRTSRRMFPWSRSLRLLLHRSEERRKRRRLLNGTVDSPNQRHLSSSAYSCRHCLVHASQPTLYFLHRTHECCWSC
jgi:hypothetical protein